MYIKWVGYTNTDDVEFVDTTRAIIIFPDSISTFTYHGWYFISKPKDGVIKLLKGLNPSKALGLVRVFSDVLVAFL